MSYEETIKKREKKQEEIAQEYLEYTGEPIPSTSNYLIAFLFHKIVELEVQINDLEKGGILDE